MVDREVFEIIALGGQGDGIAGDSAARTFVPFALPGEPWRKAGDAYVRDGAPSADRVAPACRHFGSCGGCVAQHMAPALYGRWKRQILVDALQAADINAVVAPLAPMPPASRRRIVLAALRLPEGVALGFHTRSSRRLLPIEMCTIADPMITDALPALRQVAGRLLRHRDEMRMTVTRVDAGLDVAVEGGTRDIGAAERTALADIIQQGRILRLSVDGEPIITRGDPFLTLGQVRVVPAPGVFLQALPAAEQQMVEIVSAAVGTAKAVADLFSGVGTFALPLAARARVLAIDSDAKALAALDAGQRRVQGLKPIEVRERDLVREPLGRKELEGFDAVVFDPPRAGAEAQATMLAKSTVRTVIAVSCNPTTLARDAALLLDGGYQLHSVTPIDQFLYANHLEAVAVFARPGKKKRG